jgi:hypothetical protein
MATTKKSALSAKVVQELERLGCTLNPPKRLAHPANDDSFVILEKKDGDWRSAQHSWNWAEKATEFPTDTAVRHFLDGVKWKKRDLTRAPEYDDDDERTTFAIESSNENYEFRERKRGCVLYAFGYDHTTQYHFALDLSDTSADPKVFQVDHDGSSYSEDDVLSSFLATLEPA